MRAGSLGFHIHWFALLGFAQFSVGICRLLLLLVFFSLVAQNCTDHANSSTGLLFIMCLFRYHRNEKWYQFLSLSFDLLLGCLSSLLRFLGVFDHPNSLFAYFHFYLLLFLSRSFAPQSRTIHIFTLISTTNWYRNGIIFFRYFAIKLNKSFRTANMNAKIKKKTAITHKHIQMPYE